MRCNGLWVPETLAAGFRKFWRLPRRRWPTELMPDLPSGRQVRDAWFARWSVECQHAAPLEDAIDDGMSQNVIVEHLPHPTTDLLVVKIIARFFRWRSLTTWKSHVCGVRSVRQIADLVDHEYGWV